MELSFLGCGDAFNYEWGNNAAYIKRGSSIVFFDMGQSIFAKALHDHVLDDVTDATFIITHCHNDHIGSLGEAITYFGVFVKGVTFRVVYPNPEVLKVFLSLYPIPGVTFVSALEGEASFLHYKAVSAKHIPHSYSYFVSDGSSTIYYSGDNSEINPEMLSLLKEGKLEHVYHEAASIASSFHTGLKDLADAIPASLKERVTVMHLENESFAAKAKSYGFAVATLKE